MKDETKDTDINNNKKYIGDLINLSDYIYIDDLIKRWHNLSNFTYHCLAAYKLPHYNIEKGNNGKGYIIAEIDSCEDVYLLIDYLTGETGSTYDIKNTLDCGYFLKKDIEEIEKLHPEILGNKPSNIVTLQEQEVNSIKQQITELENENAQLKNKIQELEEIPLDKRVKALVRNILSIVYDFVTKDNIAELQNDYRKVLDKGYNKIKGDNSKFNNLTYATLRGYLDRYKKLKEDKDKQDQKTK